MKEEDHGGTLTIGERWYRRSSLKHRRGHGFTVMAPTIEDCVMRAYFTQENARIATTAMLMRASAPEKTGTLQFLSAEEREGSKDMTLETCMRPWSLWKKEVESNSLYEVSFKTAELNVPANIIIALWSNPC